MAIRRVDPVVLQGEVKTIAAINKVPRALGTGKLDVTWLPYATYVVSDTEPTSPYPLTFWRDTNIGQTKVFDGTTWRTFA